MRSSLCARARDRPGAKRPGRRDHALGARLADWFEKHHRDLPWRKTADPYAIWVSEVMLQQTRVATVLGYYPRFLRDYPTVAHLARAPLCRVLASWSGLGYYQRARALHRGAREVVARYGGRLPSAAATLRDISGIGPYTAGAIASIAFGEREPAVDGNVARVLARIRGVDKDVRAADGSREIWRIASELVPEREPGRHNEALMELGATVCVPADPRCGVCPARSFCRARARGLQHELPVARRKKPPRETAVVALVSRRRGRTLLGRRRDTGLFGGLWEPPMAELGDRRSRQEALAELLGLRRLELSVVAEQTHLLTHRKLRITVVCAVLDHRDLGAPKDPYVELAWLDDAELGVVGLSTLARKVLAAAGPSRRPLVGVGRCASGGVP